MLVVFAIAIGCLCAVASLVLIVPWRIDLYIHKAAESAQVSARAHLRWTFFHWRLAGRHSSAPPLPQPTPPAPAKTRAASGGDLVSARALLFTPGLVARTWRLVTDLGRQAWPRHVVLHMRIGFDDPAETGMFFGTCQGLLCAIPHRGWVTSIEPDFDHAVAEGDAHARWSVRLLLVVWPLLTFLASPVVWRGMRAVRRARHSVVRAETA